MWWFLDVKVFNLSARNKQIGKVIASTNRLNLVKDGVLLQQRIRFLQQLLPDQNQTLDEIFEGNRLDYEVGLSLGFLQVDKFLWRKTIGRKDIAAFKVIETPLDIFANQGIKERVYEGKVINAFFATNQD